MILYHGTVDTFVPSIKQRGLLPHYHKFHFENADRDLYTRPMHDVNGEYVTSEKWIAEVFADFRARFEHAKQGDVVMFGQGENGKIKTGKTIRPKAKAVVVEIHLPDSFRTALETDVQTPNDTAYVLTTPIPPVYITEIHHVTRVHWYGK